MVEPITMAIIGSAILGGGSKAAGGIKQGKILKARGRALEEFYNNQARVNRITTERAAATAIGSVAAGGQGTLLGGSSMDAAFSKVYDLEIGQAFKRMDLRRQGVLSKAGQDFQAGSAFDSAAGAPIEAANTIFSNINREFPKGSEGVKGTGIAKAGGS